MDDAVERRPQHSQAGKVRNRQRHTQPYHGADESVSYERLHLNERPIFLRSNFIFLSIAQGVYHAWTDVSRVALPLIKPVTSDSSSSSPLPPQQILRASISQLLLGSAKRASVLTAGNLFVYALFVRRPVYITSRDAVRIIWDISPSSQPGVLPPYHWTLLARSFASGVLLLFLWDFANLTFSAYVAQEPVKNGKPLTDEAADPNGGLLNGLKSKKKLVQVDTPISPEVDRKLTRTTRRLPFGNCP